MCVQDNAQSKTIFCSEKFRKEQFFFPGSSSDVTVEVGDNTQGDGRSH